jgi:cyclopropane fatty-acyl-phospholipid synthase-like methyltransferase
MIANYLRLNIPISDKDFDRIYPETLRGLSNRHFTEVEVAIKAAQFLVTKPKQKILDIGSGVGKFCFVAGSYTDAQYTGVDYRKNFVQLCDHLTMKHGFKNVNFIHSDIKDIDFENYDNFYFFNSFLEHKDATAQIDETVSVNIENFKKYFEFLFKQFETLPNGARIVTYHANSIQIPSSYKLLGSHFDGLLKCWEKQLEN